MKRSTLFSALLCALAAGAPVDAAQAAENAALRPFTDEDLTCGTNENCLFVDETTVLDRTGFDVNNGEGVKYPEGSDGGGFGHFYQSTTGEDITGHRTLYVADGPRTLLMRPQWLYGAVLNSSAFENTERAPDTAPVSLHQNELLVVGRSTTGRTVLGFDVMAMIGNPEFVAVAAAGANDETVSIDRNRTEVRGMNFIIGMGFGGNLSGWIVSAISGVKGNVTTSMSGNVLFYDDSTVTDDQDLRTMLRQAAAAALTAVPADFTGNQFVVQGESIVEARSAHGAFVMENAYADGVDSTHAQNLFRLDGSTLQAKVFKTQEELGWVSGSTGEVNAFSNNVELFDATVLNNGTDTTRPWIAGATAAVGSATSNTLTVEGDTSFQNAHFVLMGGAVTRNADGKIRGTEAATGNSVTLGTGTVFEGQVGAAGATVTPVMVAMGGLSVGNALAQSNTVEATGLTSSADLVMAGGRGALATANDAGTAREAKASQNQVTLSGSTMTGRTRLIGGYLNATASLTSRTNMVANWFSDTAAAVPDGLATTDTLTASENIVTIEETSHAAADNELVGGAVWAKGGTIAAENNTVRIGAGVTGADGARASFARVAGGIAYGDDRSLAWKGNTLIAESAFTTGTLSVFQNYGFVVGSDAGTNSGSGGFITVTDEAVPLITSEGELTSRISVQPVTGGTLGERVVLISSASGFINGETGEALGTGDYSSLLAESFDYTAAVTPVRQSVFTGDFGDLTLSIQNDGKDLVLGGAESGGWTDETTDETDGVTYGLVADQMMLAASGDLFVDNLMRTDAALHDGWFSAAQVRRERGGTYSYAGDKRLKNDIFAGLVGYDFNVSDSTELGGFVEIGHANYDTRTPIREGNKAGSGTHNYAGAGVFVNHKLPVEGLRATAYVKAGAIQNKFDVTIAGSATDFDRTSAYWGAHLGLNYDWSLTQKLEGRAFVNYFYDGREKESYAFAGTEELAGSTFTYDALNAPPPASRSGTSSRTTIRRT